MSWDSIFIFSFLVFLVIRVPVAFALLGSSMIYLLGTGHSLMIIPQILGTTFNSFVLLCIPLFMFAGELMNTSGVSTRLFNFARSIIGHVQGGLAHVNILGSMIFAGMTGSAVADAAGLGAIEMKAMAEDGYDIEYAAAMTAASSTIGPIIPPSISMVIYGAITGTSIGALFVGGVIPGIAMGISLMIANYFISKKRNYPKFTKATWSERGIAFIKALPALVTPAVIVGGILKGICTPTEAAVLAVLYSIALGMFFYHELTWKDVVQCMFSVGKSISTIVLIVCAASVFGWILTYTGLPQRFGEALLHVSSNPYVIMLVLNLLLLFIGLFMESIAIILIMVPMLMPVIDAVGIDRVHFGVVIAINIALGLCTPPVGMCLFIVTAIGKTTLEGVCRAIWPLFLALLAALAVVSYVPATVLWLPSVLM
jgi:tripartite ATP-independent transporter DctM subunit